MNLGTHHANSPFEMADEDAVITAYGSDAA